MTTAMKTMMWQLVERTMIDADKTRKTRMAGRKKELEDKRI